MKHRSGLHRESVIGREILSTLHHSQRRCNLLKDIHKLLGSVPQNIHLCVALYKAYAHTTISDTESDGSRRPLETGLACTEQASGRGVFRAPEEGWYIRIYDQLICRPASPHGSELPSKYL